MVSCQNQKVFDVKQTSIAKGIACVLLLFHHLFYSTNSYDRFQSLWIFNGIPLESTLASMCRVCVAIFLLLSGYGVNETINKKLSVGVQQTGTIIRTSCRLIWKLWANYIVVFLCFVPWQCLFDRHPYASVVDLVFDVMGISFITNTSTMNETWWFMSVAIACYVFAPFLKILMRKCPIVFLVIVPLSFLLFLFFGSVFWCYAFILGMMASEYNIPEALHKAMVGIKRIYQWLLCGMLVIITAVLRYSSPAWGDIFLAVSIVSFSFLCVSRLRFIDRILEFIGKHSANIFFFHTFLYLYNFKAIVYAPKYAPFILLIFVVECVAVSVVIEFIKKTIGIRKGIRFVERIRLYVNSWGRVKMKSE